MGSLQIIISFAFLLFPVVPAISNNCPSRFCGNNPFTIRFPFRLPGLQPEYCGYPGFDLRCTGQNQHAVLNLSYSGDFWIRDINYLDQEIKLYDPNGCLAQRLMNLNLSSSPFTSPYYENITFLNCPRDYVARNGFRYIDCLSNSTSKVVAIRSKSFAGPFTFCIPIVTLPIPFSFPQDDNKTILYNFIEDLQLTWNVPNCQDCEARRGICGYQNSSTDQLFCFDDSNKDQSRGLQIFRIIALSIVLPAITCSICISCFMCFVESRRGPSALEATAAQNLPPPEITLVSGLDDSTIESYKKVVLGESRRLPGPNGTICPICLADYHPKDTLRCIPECEHCFHSDCIDEWLRVNGTCPICRNSPSPARLNS